MHCPKCGHEVADDVPFCEACGGRLFRWLGDPFGGLEFGKNVAAYPILRACVVVLVLGLFFGYAPVWSLLAMAVLLAVLGKRRTLDRQAFVLWLAGAVIAAIVLESLLRRAAGFPR